MSIHLALRRTLTDGGNSSSAFRRRTIVLVVLCVCVILGTVLLLNLQTPRRPAPAPSEPGRPGAESARKTPPVRAEAVEPKAEPVPVAPPATSPAPEETPSVTNADLDYIASRNLLVPVAGVKASDLRDTFSQARSEGRQHNALDIRAPLETAVLAATDGVVIKLFPSNRGGITLYQLDPSGRYVYYYAHLMRYADGIAEGKQLRRGDVIAYVGDTGNAGAGNYHLHFAISKLTSPRDWSGGDPINPYPFLAPK
jgi:murein DD-endopeptidase MepM/ murein hydrolase activator NlpD